MTAAAQNTPTQEDEVIFGAMQAELTRSMDSLRMSETGYEPFRTGYIYSDYRVMVISATLGEAVQSQFQTQRTNAVRLLLGNHAVTSDIHYNGGYSVHGSATETDGAQIRREFWLNTDASYKWAAQELARKYAILEQTSLSEEEADLGDWLDVAPVEKIVEDPDFGFDRTEWERRTEELSAVFAEFPSLYNSQVRMVTYDRTDYALYSDGVKMRLPTAFATVAVSAAVRTSDGEEFFDGDDLYATSDLTLPSQEELLAWVETFARNLSGYAVASKMEEFYSGPVLFVGTPVFDMFDGNLLSSDGNRLLIKRKPAGQQGGMSPRRLEKRIGQRVLDRRFTVTNHTSHLREYNGIPLLGYHEIGADGVVPEPSRVLIEAGTVKTLLAGRIPTPGDPEHKADYANRFSANLNPFVAPGTLQISATDTSTVAELERRLVKLAGDDGLDCAYIVERMNGRVTLVWRVDVATGEKSLVRNAEVTPVSFTQLKRVAGVSSESAMRNYLAGQVPASMIYPRAVLLEDVEIGVAEIDKEKPSPIVNPLERNDQ